MIEVKVSMEAMFDGLSDEEGLKLSVYRCPGGHLTVGIGHNLDTEPEIGLLGKKLKFGDVITRTQALQLFDKDVSRVITKFKKQIPWFLELSAARQYVLISLGFNLGVPGLMKFKNTLYYLKSGNIEKTCQELRSSRWFKQVGKRGPKLLKIMTTDEI